MWYKNGGTLNIKQSLKKWPLFFRSKIGIFNILFKSQKHPLIANIAKNAVSGLRQFLATESPWKITKNTFYFTLTNWICYWQIRYCSYYAFAFNQMFDIREVWKYWPLKDDFRLILKKFYRAAISWRVDQKNFKLLADISFESGL